ncbi:MAG: hypothetical protein HGB12_17240 [Bacteroidetes bacterium]|nr:hypothetical protein [Bacteroidota bacterium]
MNGNQINSLHGLAQFTLFVSSYLPLFILIIIRQFSENIDFLNWAGLTFDGVCLFFSKFGLAIILLIIGIIGWFGYSKTLGNIQEVAKNGYPVTVKDVKNKNSEAIGYIATYIIPFLFQSFNGWYECFSILFLLTVIYKIYINSSLILINPLLSFKYAIYEIEYTENGKTKNGLIISTDKYLQDDARIKIYEIGHKLYFLLSNNQNE